MRKPALFIFLCFCSPVWAQDLYYIFDQPQVCWGDTYVFHVTPEMIKHAPRWKNSDEAPKVSPRKAAKIAIQQLAGAFPLVPRWEIQSVTLQKVNPDDWIYVVQLSDHSSPGSGTPWALFVPVLLDGRTVAPTLIESREQKEKRANKRTTDSRL